VNHPPADHPSLTLVQISDLHLQPPVPGKEATRLEKIDRFEQLLRLALAQKPDRIILSGDLTEDGFDDINELAWARDLLASQQTPPILLIPGNHDVGDKPGSGPNAIDATRLANWKDIFEKDHFVEDLAHWRLIGLNSLLVNSGLPEESQQLHWLDTMLEQASRLDQQVAIFMHEPPFLGTPGQPFGNRSDYWAIAPEKQETYLQRLSHPRVRLVASGHVHWHHAFTRNNVLHCWCPSSAFIVDDPNFPRGGGITGLIVYRLGANAVTHEVIPFEYDKAGTKVIPFYGA